MSPLTPHLDGLQLHAKVVVFHQQVPVFALSLLQLGLQFRLVFPAFLLEFPELLLRVLCPAGFPDVSSLLSAYALLSLRHGSVLYSTPHDTDDEVICLKVLPGGASGKEPTCQCRRPE